MFLEIKDLKKGFGSGDSRTEVLRGIDFSVEKGEFCVLLGPSGSGKSTLLNIIGGIDDADAGYISIGGERMADMNEKKILAYINESIQTIKDGKEIKPNAFEEKKPEGIFKNFLKENTDVKKAFEKLTKGKQKEYVVYIDEAKQEKTKTARLQKIKELILQNKGLNDKYKTK